VPAEHAVVALVEAGAVPYRTGARMSEDAYRRAACHVVSGAPRQHRYEQQEKGAGRGLTCSFSTEVDAIQYATQNGLESDE
jgi:hypothetical protein